MATISVLEVEAEIGSTSFDSVIHPRVPVFNLGDVELIFSPDGQSFIALFTDAFELSEETSTELEAALLVDVELDNGGTDIPLTNEF